MSELKVNSIVDASSGNTVQINGQTPSESNMQGRNRIINGDMRIDQRNAGAAVTASGTFPVDRWQKIGTASASLQRSTTAPSGFTNSLLLTVTATGDASSTLRIQQHIEGFNVADLGWGTASAQNVAVSFSVNCSVTGTYSVRLSNSDGNRVYFETFVVNSANTWEYKTLTIPGDTTGTWLTDNGRGITVAFVVAGATAATPNVWGTAGTSATGQINLCLTNGATFFITGVQLEAGAVATPFERRPFGTELAFCQRYYQTTVTKIWVLSTNNAARRANTVIFPVTMRAAPTTVVGSGINAWSSVVVEPTADGFAVDGTMSNSTFSQFIAGYTATAEL